MSVFLTSNAELRSGWRCAVYVAIFAILLFASGALVSLLPGQTSLTSMARIAVNGAVVFPPAILTLLFMARFVDGLPIAVFGLTFHPRWSRDLWAGLLVAAFMLGLYLGSGALLGSLTVEAAEPGRWTGLVLVVLLLGLSAANEELIFRGYLLQVLMVGIGRGPAIVAISAIFGLGHHLNPGASWMGTTNTFLAGILLSLAYLQTRSLWFPYGLHVGWNAGIGVVFGFPVSGVETPALWHSEISGPDWLVGGPFGPEGGILGTGVIIAAVVLIGAGRWMRISPSIQALLDRHSAKVYRDARPS